MICFVLSRSPTRSSVPAFNCSLVVPTVVAALRKCSDVVFSRHELLTMDMSSAAARLIQPVVGAYGSTENTPSINASSGVAPPSTKDLAARRASSGGSHDTFFTKPLPHPHINDGMHLCVHVRASGHHHRGSSPLSCTPAAGLGAIPVRFAFGGLRVSRPNRERRPGHCDSDWRFSRDRGVRCWRVLPCNCLRCPVDSGHVRGGFAS